MDEILEVTMWDAEREQEFKITRSLEGIILNPSGIKMEHMGLILFNRERKLRGLPEYRYNSETGTYDENKV